MSLKSGKKGPRVPNRKAHERRSKADRKVVESQEILNLRKLISQGIQFKEPPTKFSEIPISSRTLRGLEENHFLEMTDIQKCALPVALTGLDILGAAKTGSGKTLAFLIPILEKLYLENWTSYDGLGALVIAPTRELALQIFEVLRKVGKHHMLSAGLVIGGKDLKSEQESIARMNILVATPGRLLQHMDQTNVFEWSQLKLLVLDEADRMLDLGFAKTLDAIVSALPRERQTMLFSATQTDSIQALARLSLKEPVEMSVHAQQEHATPEKLDQKYIMCPLEEKMDRLYSFIKANIKCKTIIFLSSCKEVRFLYEAFCRMQPGVPLMHLHGRLKQHKRMNIFYDFCRKPHALLLATDVAARGLDFPAVDWVVQADCPEDVETYIHRVGRTARFNKAGNALLFLLPSEAKMVELLGEKKIPITSMYPEGRALPPPKRPIKSQLQALCSQDPEIKYLGQKALVSYVRSVFLTANKDVFKVHDLPVDAFAESLGLAGAPKLRFIAKSAAKNASRQAAAALAQAHEESDDGEGSGDSDADEAKDKKKKAQPVRRIDKMFNRKNLDVLSEHYEKLREKDSSASGGEDEDEFLSVKRRDHEINPDEMIPVKTLPYRPARRDILKTKKSATLKNAPQRSHVVFDEDDETHDVLPFEPENTFDRSKANTMAREFMQGEQAQMVQIDKVDAAKQRMVRRNSRIDKKRKQKEAARESHLAKAPRLESSKRNSYSSDEE